MTGAQGCTYIHTTARRWRDSHSCRLPRAVLQMCSGHITSAGNISSIDSYVCKCSWRLPQRLPMSLGGFWSHAISLMDKAKGGEGEHWHSTHLVSHLSDKCTQFILVRNTERNCVCLQENSTGCPSVFSLILASHWNVQPQRKRERKA